MLKKKPPKKESIFDFKILGIDNSIDKDKEVPIEITKFIESCFQLAKQTKYELEKTVEKHLRGDFTKEEFNKTIQNYATIQEALKYIPGRSTVEEHLNSKRQLIKRILDKLRELLVFAESNKIYKDDYKKIKEMLLQSLFELFATSKDIANIDYTIPILEKMEMIPINSRDEVITLCPIGHWR